jgi:hypothetical protein
MRQKNLRMNGKLYPIFNQVIEFLHEALISIFQIQKCIISSNDLSQ